MKNKFKNIILLLTTLIIVCVCVEIISFLFLKHSNKLQFSYPYFNQQISPYYVYGNSPGFEYKNCIKSNPNESDVTIDQYGFVSGAPVKKQKDKNTLRIFITGGSGPFGSGQTNPYETIKPFPVGLYSFESSIAGKLEKKLKKIFPSKNVEVVNACSFQWMLHQSIAYYLETISEFNPDIIISIDGNNDIASMCGFSPYYKGSIDFVNYIKLNGITQLNQDKSFLNIINLINTLKLYNLKNKDKTNNTFKDKKDYFIYSYDSTRYKDYVLNKKRFVQGSEKFVKSIKYYHSICKIDKVKFIFCLQPLLYRQKFNKTLSLSEKAMQNTTLNPKLRGNQNKIFSPQFIDLINRGSNLILKYFIDDYLSEKINQISIDDGFTFVDMNKEIMPIQSNIDLYVDYCHLTIEGNEIVAEILSKKINTLLSISPKM